MSEALTAKWCRDKARYWAFAAENGVGGIHNAKTSQAFLIAARVLDTAAEDRLAWVLCEADGENPDAFHTKADFEYADKHGAAMPDHAIPLWLGYRKKARAILAHLKSQDPTS